MSDFFVWSLGDVDLTRILSDPHLPGTKELTHCGQGITYMASQKTWSTLDQVLAYYLPAPSYYLTQCWLIENGTCWNTLKWIFNRNSDMFIQFKKKKIKMSSVNWWSFWSGFNEWNRSSPSLWFTVACIVHKYLDTVQCHYNVANFLQNSRNRHSIACPWGWDMECFFCES